VLAGPVDAAGDVVEAAATVVAQHPHRHQRGAGGDALDADSVAGRGADDPQHVGAVTVAVLRRAVALDRVVARPEAAGEVGVARLDAGVDHGNARAGAARHRPGAVSLDEVEVPLLAATWVGGGGRSRGDQAGQQRERKGPGHGASAMPALAAQ
jgi:hypothetical protein